MENNKETAKEWFVKSDYQYKLDEHDEGGFIGIDEDVVAEMLDEYHKFKSEKKKLTNLICALGANITHMEKLLSKKYVSKTKMRQVLMTQMCYIEAIENLKK